MKKKSLQRRLTVMLGWTVLFAGMISGGVSFKLAYHEAKEFQDDMLRQIGLMTLQHNSDNRSHQPSPDIVLNDAESKIRVVRIPGDPAPSWFDPNLSPGLHTVETDQGKMRIFLKKDRPGGLTLVFQPTASRDEIAVNSALQTLFPWLIIFPVMVLLIGFIIKNELRSVRELSTHLDEQPAEQPGLLPDKDLPQEIIPFVHAINRLLDRITVLMGQQRRFIADAAHELRTPLAALSIQAQNILHAGSPEETARRITPLRDGIERVRKLTEQLLNLARVQAETPQNTTVDVSSIARDILAEYLSVAEEKGIDLGLDESESVFLIGNTGNIRLIMKNALENALKYTPPGGEVTIRLVNKNDGKVGFEISDTGPGIHEHERETVFEPFFRSPDATGEGNGLGLAIAKSAADSLGGCIDIMNRLDRTGMIFRYLQ